ncbi:MAG TPA: hypothetical protein VF628_04080 [Allosphingosinicella sp.]|jgi:hypothetical protein
MLKPSTLTDNNPERSLTKADRMARLLGWFSLGLGAFELAAPGRIAKAVGLEGKETLLRAYGGREIVAGVGALSVDAAPAIWSRVAGDLLDLGTLAMGRKDADGDQRRYAGYAIAAVVGITLVDLLVAGTLTRQRSRSRGETRDYSDRSGFPGGAAGARGAAGDFQTPPDYRAAPQLAGVATLQ